MKLGANDSERESPTIITQTHKRTAELSWSGRVSLRDFLIKQEKLYSAGMEERIDCYKKAGKSISRYDQYKSLTEIWADDPDFRKYSATASRSTHIKAGSDIRTL